MEIIYTTLVGSKMHGLNTPESDDDVRHITMHPIRHVLSPFKNEEIKVKNTNGEDVESWELCHFVKHLTQGNPTCYEVIKSPLYEKLPWADRIRDLMPLSFDGVKIMYAHIGYAEAQLKRYLRKADAELRTECFSERLAWYHNHKLSLIWEDNQLRRIPKSVVAAYRVLAQGRQLLDTGDFQPVVKNYSPKLHDKLMEIKLMNHNDLDWVFATHHLTAIELEIKDLKDHYETLPDSVKYQKPDIEKIEDILCEIYGV